MSYYGADRAYRLFQVNDFDRSPEQRVRFAEPAASFRVPGFLVLPEPSDRSWFASLKAICTRTKLTSNGSVKYFNGRSNLTGFRFPSAGVLNSLILHCALIVGIVLVPMMMPTRTPALSAAFLPPEVLFYPVPEPKPHAAPRLPRIAPPGPGGRPGHGIHPNLPPDPGKTVSNADLTAISKPVHPDNHHQTIIQPASPPDLRIPNDIQVPNLSLGSVNAPKKPDFDLSLKKPTQENAKVAPSLATPEAETNVDMSLVTSLQPTTANPKLPIPVGAIAKPQRRDAGTADQTSGSTIPEVGTAGDGRAILALGISPSGSTSGLALPPGNRWGDFAIAPGAGTSGAPGGRADGVPGGGGKGGDGRSGDESVGIGPGHSGGGGGKNGSQVPLSIKGTGTGIAGAPALDPLIQAKVVYPVPASLNTKLRRNQMVVSAGPTGGGGLNAYGALTCGKIYTIFLPMTGGGWTMEYCEHATGGDAPKAVQSSTVVRLEQGLVPPDPDLESRYDFKRMPVPPGKSQKLIVLKGSVKEDGSVSDLQVFEGIVPQMDEAARVAFSRWKFRPATRGGKPVPLDVLIGIPTESDAATQQ